MPAEPLEVGPSLGHVADPHEPDDDDRAAMESRRQERGLARRDRVAGQGRLARRRGQKVAPGADGVDARAIERVEVALDRQRLAGRRVEPELELGHDTEVAAPAAQTPVQVRMLGRARADRLASGRDDRVRLDVVARQPVLAGQPAHAATERQPADARVGDVARRRGQAVPIGRSIESAKKRTTLDRRPPSLRVDADLAHR